MRDTLEKYFAETGDNASKLAARARRAVSTVTRVLRGERGITSDLADDLEAATGGKITAAQWFAICHAAKKARKGDAATPPGAAA